MGALSLIFTFASLLKTLARIAWALVKCLWAAVRLLTRGFFALIHIITHWSGRGIGDDTLVRVRRDWNDHRVATVTWSDLRDPRWDDVSGGEQNHTSQPFIYGYVWCDQVQGDIAHSCIHGPPPHNIKVCLVKKDNSKQVWNRLQDLAGPKPRRRWLIGGYRWRT